MVRRLPREAGLGTFGPLGASFKIPKPSCESVSPKVSGATCFLCRIQRLLFSVKHGTLLGLAVHDCILRSPAKARAVPLRPRACKHCRISGWQWFFAASMVKVQMGCL